MPSAEGRMARQAVLFDVAPDARLEALACCLSVTGDEEIIEIVIAGPQRTAVRDQAGRGVTRRAEARRVVSIAAPGLAGVGRRGMARQEAGWMVARCTGGIGPVAL